MLHRDYIVINKIIEEMNMGISLLGDVELHSFLQDELLKEHWE